MSKNINNKGFTLVELLAVIVMLISISLVVVGGISASLERRDEKKCMEQQELAIGAAKIYFSMVTDSNVVDGVIVGDLIDGNYLDSKYVDDSDGKLERSDKITFPNGSNQYKYNGKNVGDSCY